MVSKGKIKAACYIAYGILILIMVRVRVGKYTTISWSEKVICTPLAINLDVLSVNPGSAIKKIVAFFIFTIMCIIISYIYSKQANFKRLGTLFIATAILMEIFNILFARTVYLDINTLLFYIVGCLLGIGVCGIVKKVYKYFMRNKKLTISLKRVSH